jgi:hypothetical protein
VTIQQYSADVGNGTDTSIVVTHSLDTRDVLVEVFRNSTGATELCDVTRSSTTQVTLGFDSAPAAGALRVVVTG